MAFSALIRTLERSQLSAELLSKLQQQGMLHLSGLPRLPKGLVASALAQGAQQHLVVVTATVEEGGRWAAQLEAMDWKSVHFYPTTESSPYGDASLESEMIWGQMQGLAEVLAVGSGEHFDYAQCKRGAGSEARQRGCGCSDRVYDVGVAAALTISE